MSAQHPAGWADTSHGDLCCVTQEMVQLNIVRVECTQETRGGLCCKKVGVGNFSTGIDAVCHLSYVP